MQTKLFSSLLVLLLGLLSALYLWEIKSEATNFLYSDYGKFYASDQFAAQNKSFYTTIFFLKKSADDPLAKFTLHRMSGNLNPPFFNMLIYPLTRINYATSLKLWLALNIFSGILAICLLPLIFKKNHPLFFLGAVVGLFAYYPTLFSVQFGQITLLILPLIITAWWAARNDKLILTGIILGIAVNIKLFFGLFAIYFLLRREWRGFCWFTGTALCCALLPLLFFSVSNYFDYHTILQHISWYSSSWNASIFGFMLRVFGGEEKNIPLFNLPRVGYFLYLICSGLILLGWAKFIYTQKSSIITSQQKTDLDFSLTLITLLLVTPLNWIYYFPLLVIPFAILVQWSLRGRFSLALQLTIVTAFIFSSMPYPSLEPKDIHGASDILLSSGFYFYALLMLWGILFCADKQLANSATIKPSPLPQNIIILLGIMAFLPSLVGMLGVAHTLHNNPQRYMPIIKMITPVNSGTTSKIGATYDSLPTH